MPALPAAQIENAVGRLDGGARDQQVDVVARVRRAGDRPRQTALTAGNSVETRRLEANDGTQRHLGR